MTVAELIDELEKCPQDARVEIIATSQSKPRVVDIVRAITHHRPGHDGVQTVELRPIA